MSGTVSTPPTGTLGLSSTSAGPRRCRQDIQDAEVHWTTKHGKSVCMSLQDLRDAKEAQLTLGTDTEAY